MFPAFVATMINATMSDRILRMLKDMQLVLRVSLMLKLLVRMNAWLKPFRCSFLDFRTLSQRSKSFFLLRVFSAFYLVLPMEELEPQSWRLEVAVTVFRLLQSHFYVGWFLKELTLCIDNELKALIACFRGCCVADCSVFCK